MGTVGAVELAHPDAKGGVLAYVSPGQEAVILDDQPGMRARPGERLAAYQDGSGQGLTQTGEQIEQGGFSAAGGADHRPGITGLRLPGEILEEGRSRAVAKGNLFEAEHLPGLVDWQELRVHNAGIGHIHGEQAAINRPLVDIGVLGFSWHASGDKNWHLESVLQGLGEDFLLDQH